MVTTSSFCKQLGHVVATLFLSATLVTAAADASPSDAPLRIGIAASLSSFAAPYGTAVLEGAQLAAGELATEGSPVQLFVEDDLSNSKALLNAYQKLTQVHKVQAIVGGTWWLDAIVKQAEAKGLPVVSCETLFDNGTLASTTRFIMQGDLREWVRVFEPTVQERGWKRGAAVRFTSAFGVTLADEMKALFSRDGREFAGEVEYSTIEVDEAAAVVLQLKKLKPEVVYIDGQPNGLAALLRRFKEQGLGDVGILTNSIAPEAAKQGLIDPKNFPNLYFSRRATSNDKFRQLFKAKFNKEPQLQSDLGYYAVHLLAEAFKAPEPLRKIREGMTIKGEEFKFDERGVLVRLQQEVGRL